MQPTVTTKLPFLIYFCCTGLARLFFFFFFFKSLENNDAALMPWSYMEIYKAFPGFNWFPATVCT